MPYKVINARLKINHCN